MTTFIDPSRPNFEAFKALPRDEPIHMLNLLRYREQGRTTSLFDGAPPEHVASLGQRVRPSLVDLFMALTRNPALNGKQA